MGKDFAHDGGALHDEEKQHTTFVENAADSPTDTSLHREKTLDSIDVQNTHAYLGDDSDGKVHWTFRSILAAMCLAGLYTGRFNDLCRQLNLISVSGSQVILYFTGGSLGFIEEDLGLSRGSAWLPTANILAIAAACPYAGYLQDLFGKRYIALFGAALICIGCLLMATTQSFAQALAGMAISGVGAAVGELTGLAG